MKRKQDSVKDEKGSANGESGDRADQVIIRPLGAGQEVGRSCFLLRYQGKGVMFDCGIHPAYSGTLVLLYLCVTFKRLLAVNSCAFTAQGDAMSTVY
jgi:predicted metal-dependent RNase